MDKPLISEEDLLLYRNILEKNLRKNHPDMVMLEIMLDCKAKRESNKGKFNNFVWIEARVVIPSIKPSLFPVNAEAMWKESYKADPLEVLHEVGSSIEEHLIYLRDKARVS